MCEVPVFGRVFPYQAFTVFEMQPQGKKDNFLVTYNRYNKQYVLHYLKGI